MTAPDSLLVDAIADALESHLGLERETWNIDPEYFREQARAVLAALSEAGAVVAGIGYGVRLKSGDVERCGASILDAKEHMADMVGWHDDYYNPVEVVTRTTTTITHRTNWTAVEG